MSYSYDEAIAEESPVIVPVRTERTIAEEITNAKLNKEQVVQVINNFFKNSERKPVTNVFLKEMKDHDDEYLPLNCATDLEFKIIDEVWEMDVKSEELQEMISDFQDQLDELENCCSEIVDANENYIRAAEELNDAIDNFNDQKDNVMDKVIHTQFGRIIFDASDYLGDWFAHDLDNIDTEGIDAPAFDNGTSYDVIYPMIFRDITVDLMDRVKDKVQTELQKASYNVKIVNSEGDSIGDFEFDKTEELVKHLIDEW